MAHPGSNQQVTPQQILNAGYNFATSAFNVSLTGDSITVSANTQSPDAGLFRTSSLQGDAGLLRVSSIGNDAGNDRTSALQGDAGLFRSSSLQGDAGLQHVSARIFGDTTGNLTIASLLNLSSSQTVKSTAGAIYGLNMWNTDSKPVYFKFYNTSGAINVGTDTPLLRFMVPASADRYVDYPEGLKGFTNGIGVVALSAQPDSGINPGAASATGVNVFYV